MTPTLSFLLWISAAVTHAAIPAPVVDGDWPQWRGPDRNGISQETGLLSSWPAEGPAEVWSVSNLGSGYGAVATAGEHVFVQGTRGDDSVVFALNRAEGGETWTRAVGPTLDQDRGPGPRGTPTVDDDRIYVLTEAGDLACLKRDDGAIVWQRNILDDFGGKNPRWHISESPLIDGDHLIVAPGGKGAGMAALDKMTGETVWTTEELSDPAGYASSLIAEVQGVRTIIGFTAQAGVGVRASDGQLMWRYEPVANRVANIATPLFHDDKVFYTSAYDTGAALLDLTADNGQVRAEEVYFTRDMQNHHGGVVLVDGVLYGFSNLILTAMDFATGETLWRDRSVGKGSLTYADGHLYLLSENNVVGLAEATPEEYRERGRFEIAEEGLPTWAHPVVSGGRLFIRNQGTLTAYDVRADQ